MSLTTQLLKLRLYFYFISKNIMDLFSNMRLFICLLDKLTKSGNHSYFIISFSSLIAQSVCSLLEGVNSTKVLNFPKTYYVEKNCVVYVDHNSKEYSERNLRNKQGRVQDLKFGYSTLSLLCVYHYKSCWRPTYH